LPTKAALGAPVVGDLIENLPRSLCYRTESFWVPHSVLIDGEFSRLTQYYSGEEMDGRMDRENWYISITLWRFAF